jgi:hypothetical protein
MHPTGTTNLYAEFGYDIICGIYYQERVGETALRFAEKISLQKDSKVKSLTGSILA